MEHEEELTEPDSNIRFIVPDSQFSDDGSQDLGLLPALKPQFLFVSDSVVIIFMNLSMRVIIRCRE